ncbi:MAG: triose-phosphate isomerase [Ignavibacteria bacterium]|nr:triose-phosphate isomerase [Ignavibacteria bacterium]
MKKLVAGNWKMNKTNGESYLLSREIIAGLTEKEFLKCDVVLCPPFTSLASVHSVIKESEVRLGAQNMHYKEDGAFTGEISGRMLVASGCDYVILGHSERRQFFYETDHLINLKIKKAISDKLIPIICVGETLEQRESGVYEKVVDEQVTLCLKEITKDDIEKILIAYEPVWAIGTGKTATPEQANSMHKKIREALANLFGEEISSKIRILYGGSVNDKNAKELFSQSDIYGGLIGGASLKPESFINIIKNT